VAALPPLSGRYAVSKADDDLTAKRTHL